MRSLLSEPFYRLTGRRLSEKGVAVFQTDSPTVNPRILRTTIDNVALLFERCRPYICAMPSFPEGICSFCLCTGKDGVTDRADKKRISRLAGSCRYFNEDIYNGAFLLPGHVREICGVYERKPPDSGGDRKPRANKKP